MAQVFEKSLAKMLLVWTFTDSVSRYGVASRRYQAGLNVNTWSKAPNRQTRYCLPLMFFLNDRGDSSVGVQDRPTLNAAFAGGEPRALVLQDIERHGKHRHDC